VTQTVQESPAAPVRLPIPAAWRWPSGFVGVPLVALAIVAWARTRPGFDPYGWLVWGHQALVGALNTNAAPSWKPLPFLFTLPFAVAGHYQLWLWMVASVAVSISGMIFAGRIVWFVLDPPPERRLVALVVAILGGLAVNLISRYWHYILSDQSDPMIVSLCLAAIDCHLRGRHRWAVACGVLAGLGRPEVWAFLGLYTLWGWRRVPSLRWVLVAAWAVTLFMWFGIPSFTSRSPFVSADNAFYSGRRLHHDLVFGTVGRLLDLLPGGLEAGVLVSLVIALWRRDRTTLVFFAIVVIWLVIEIAFVIHGWPGVPRYMFEPAGLMAVIAAIGVGRLALWAADGTADSPARGAVRLPVPALPAGTGIVRVGGALVAAAIVASVIPAAISDARVERRDMREQRLRTHTINYLGAEIAGLGGSGRFQGCGEPLTRLQYQSVVAWHLRVNVASVGWKYGPAIASTRPIVLFTPYPQSGSGWKIQALHQRTARCRSLPG